MTVNGIDVASYQSSHYPTSGLDFAFVKATEGHSYTNPKHAAQVATARDAGLLVGHYHFARAGSMSTQADYFLAHTGTRAGDVLAFDWEDAAVSAADKDAWLRHVRAKAPEHRVVLYCNRDFWLHRDRTSFCASGLWVADPSAPKGRPRIEHPWLFHQYSDAGGLDHNVGNFPDRTALHHWAAGTTTAHHLEDDMQMTDIVKLAAWVKRQWPTDKGLQDDLTVRTILGSGYAHARRADDTTRQILARLDAQSAALTELARALASRDGTVDVDGLVERIEQAISRIDVHLTTSPTGE